MKHQSSAMLCAILACASSSLAGDWGDLDPPSEVPVQVPQGYDGTTPTPMLLLLHGYGPVGGEWSDDAVLGFATPAWTKGWLLVRPTGSSDGWCYYWNASDACCDFYDEAPDHVSYLLAVVQHVQAMYNVHPRHIHVAGYSNGGFMAHRLGCEHPDVFASVTSIAGMGPESMASCAPTDSLNVLQVHGTNDRVIRHGGGLNFGARYPSAHQTLRNWAMHLGAATEPVVAGEHEAFDALIATGTTTDTYFSPIGAKGGVVRGLDAQGSSHILRLSALAFTTMFDWFKAHPSPTCDGDTTGDLKVDFEDLLVVLSAADEASIAIDVGMVMTRWGDCS